eukprot:scaffold26199_cov215-Cylindrotheca_fusiformis.AAC.4
MTGRELHHALQDERGHQLLRQTFSYEDNVDDFDEGEMDYYGSSSPTIVSGIRVVTASLESAATTENRSGWDTASFSARSRPGIPRTSNQYESPAKVDTWFPRWTREASEQENIL